MEVQTVMVTQATNKLGLKFVQQLVSLPYPPTYVFATYETEENLEDLQYISSENSSVILLKVDLKRPEDICEAKSVIEDVVQNRGLDLLINVVCAADVENLQSLSDMLDMHFFSITLAPLPLFKIMQPLLELAALRHIDSTLQSKSVFLNVIEDTSTVSAPEVNLLSTGIEKEKRDYDVVSALLCETCKVALNMIMDIMADKVRKKGVLVCNTYLNAHSKNDDDELQLEHRTASILLYTYHLYESRCKIKSYENIIQQF